MKSIVCPHCGEKTILKDKKIFDDAFQLKEVRKVCAFCGGGVEENGSDSGKNTPDASKAASERLSALLGGEKSVRSSFAPDADDGRVCLHCRHYIKHPFMDRCSITLQEINVMESCAQFEPR